MITLTDKQHEVLCFIIDYIGKHKCAPSNAEISEGLGWGSPEGARIHLIAIERKKWIEKAFGKIRAIKVLGDPREVKE